TFLLLYATFRVITRRGAALALATVAIASPVMAFPLAMGITDPPVIALTCLALALVARFRGDRWWPGIVLGVVCAMKYTAWPALAVLTVMVAVRDGARAGARFGATALGTAIALAAALAPAALRHPSAIVANTVAYPLGLTAAYSPAQSPLPGHLLATLGPAGHAAAITLLALAGVALAASLITAPPASPARQPGPSGGTDRPRADRAVRAVAGDPVRLLLLPARPVRLGGARRRPGSRRFGGPLQRGERGGDPRPRGFEPVGKLPPRVRA